MENPNRPVLKENVGIPMYSLAFDTTAAACSIALLRDDKTVASFSRLMDFGQSELLIPEIKNILEQNNLTFADLRLLTVCTGPGSFTGVRAGISAARSFGIACPELTVCGVDAFAAYAVHWACNPEEIADFNLVVIETKREDFYYQIFDKSLKPLTEPSAAMFEDVLPQLRYKKVSIIGDGVERFLMRPTNLSLHCIGQMGALPVEYLGAAGLRQFRAKRTDYPKPLYLRAPDVCVKA